MSEPHLHKVLRQEMERRGLNQHSLAVAAGLKPDAVRDIFRSKSASPRGNTIQALAEFLEIDMAEMLGAPVRRASAIAPARENGIPSTGEHDPHGDGVVEIDALAGAGSGGEDGIEAFTQGETDIISAEAIRDYWGLPDSYLRGELGLNRKRARIIEVRGDSMAPTLRSGDRIMLDLKDRMPSPPGMFAIWDGFGVAVKRLEVILNADPPSVRIISDNPGHQAEERTAEEINIIGRVVWLARRI